MSEVKNRKRTKVVAKPPVTVAQSDAPEPEERKKNHEEMYKESLKAQRKTRIWARVMLVAGAFVVGYFMKSNEKPFATFKDHHPLRLQKLECTIPQSSFPDCLPEECARLVSDNLVPHNDAYSMRQFAMTHFKKAKPVKGPVNIFPISNSSSFQHTFKQTSDLTTTKAFMIFRLMVANILYLIEEKFNVNKDNLYLTHPIFISQITNNTPITIHDEYYSEHIDADTYPAFHYTALLYLSDFSKDFTGGRFVFNDKNQTKYTVDPKLGRMIIFSSGSENTHYIEKVKSGTRYAMTIPFTCDKKFALAHSSLADFGLYNAQ